MKDYLLVAISAIFVVIGCILLPRDPDAGIVALAMFGPCLVFFAYAILRRHRRKRVPLQAQVLGGTPLRPLRGRLLMLGLGMLVLGTVLATHGAGAGRVFVWLTGFVAGFGAVLSVLVLLRVLPAGYVQFDPDALVIGTRRDTVRVPWSAISGMAETELHHNPVVLIWVGDPAALNVQPESRTARVLARMTSSRNWLGADFAIMCSQYGIDSTVLLVALGRYAAEPAARAELAPRARVAAASA
ncbi:hypothetical protein [Niveibacterium sp. SC-1]|uniref:hypothetical protein n=1 Tax=Niveibacterium sp. SC-1 TaxID=3135646 RepID=UPI00311E7812